ncbi:MAG: hypothetical protein ABJG15_05400 [Hyphomonadaceae bacterium]
MKNTTFLLLLMIGFSGPIHFASAQIATPLEVPDLVFWVDAEDVNGDNTVPANGATVSTWVDKSGDGNDLTLEGGTVSYAATGFDGINPGMEFSPDARMAGPNPFTGTFQNEMTIFFVNANNSLTRNFALSLNGTNTSSNIADGRFSFHAPWITNTVFFDAGACCGTTRLQGAFPNALTETTLYSALNDQPGNQQLLRLDGQAFLADTTGHNGNVSRGVHVGSISGDRPFDGRFAEILIYDRGLTLAEIQDVECFLLLKWKLASAPSGCAIDVDVVKTVAVFNEAGGVDNFSIPGNDVTYTIEVTHRSGPAVDSGSVFLVDTLPPETIFFNGDADGAGPETAAIIATTDAPLLVFDPLTDVGFSSLITEPNDMADCTYTPVSGYDPNVRHICIEPSGVLSSDLSDRAFSVSFRARIQ